MNTPQNPAPQWAVEAAADVTRYLHREFAAGFTYDEAEVAAIIARHAPQPTAPTAQPSPAGEPHRMPCPHCGSTLLWSDDRGAHCDGCDDFDPEKDLPLAGAPTTTEKPTDTKLVVEPTAPCGTATPRAGITALVAGAFDGLNEKIARLETELAEARAELANEKGQWELEARNAGRLQDELTAAQGVIARLREAAEFCATSHAWQSCRQAAQDALSLTPATYGDALAKAEAEVVRLTRVAQAQLGKLNEIHTLRIELATMTGNAEKERLDKEQARAELAELRGLLGKADRLVEAYADTIDMALGQSKGTFKELNMTWREIRARLAKKENPS